MKKRVRKLSGLLALVLALVLCLGLLPGAALAAEENELRVALNGYTGNYSPFFAANTADMQIVGLTSDELLPTDRGGAVLTRASQGETVAYGDRRYTYYGMADLDLEQKEDGSVVYTYRMRDDIRFADGVPATIDDVIFSLYVFLDPAYHGTSVLYELPIEGVEAYRSGMSTLLDMLLDAGRGNDDFTYWDVDTQVAFWEDLYDAGVAFAEEIIDYCLVNYADDFGSDFIGATGDEIRDDPALQIKLAMVLWGYESVWYEGITAADFFSAMLSRHEQDYRAVSEIENAGTLLFDLLAHDYYRGVSVGESAPNVSGIERVDDYTLRLHLTEFHPQDLYSLTLLAAPLHYYGDTAQYDYAADRFGFPKGDLSLIHTKDGAPLGCGPFSFESETENGLTLKANPYYYKGAPRIGRIRVVEDHGPKSVGAAVYDVESPDVSVQNLQTIRLCNENGELSGDAIYTSLVDFQGYGYIGANADQLNVAGVPDSAASKALRKGFMTALAVFRREAQEHYYGALAEVIEYPISKTSWAYPQPGSEGYRAAYSTDAAGQPIYSDSMSQAERENAAKAAAVAFFKAAGFTFDEAKGRFTDMDTVYEIMIPGSDHPAYEVALRAARMLKEIGVSLQVITEFDWIEVMDNNTAMMWAAAWGSALDPDMTQVYHSENAHGNGTNANHYAIDDPALDELIVRGRSSGDTEERKTIYKEAMELVMDWGVELPYYQRKNATIFCAKRVDLYTLPADMTPYYDWMAEIEKLALLGTGPLNGDVDGNGVVDARDARALFLGVSERAFTPTAEELEREDMIRDGVLNNRDVIRLFRLAAGIE